MHARQSGIYNTRAFKDCQHPGLFLTSWHGEKEAKFKFFYVRSFSLLETNLVSSQSKLEWIDSSCGIYAKMKTFQAQHFPAHDTEDITKLLGKHKMPYTASYRYKRRKKKKAKVNVNNYFTMILVDYKQDISMRVLLLALKWPHPNVTLLFVSYRPFRSNKYLHA